MEKRGKSIYGGMKIIGNFYSAMPRQAKKAETDGPSNTSGTALGEGIAHQGIEGRSFPVLDFLKDNKYRVEQSKTDKVVRKTYRKLPE